MILKLEKQHQGLTLYNVYINDDPGWTLGYFSASQIESPIHLKGENCNKVIYGETLATKDTFD